MKLSQFIILAITFTISNAKAQLNNDILYYITVDRFFDGNSKNNCGTNDSSIPSLEQTLNQLSCNQNINIPSKYQGGDFEGIQAKLNYIKSLGVTKIILSPIFENTRGLFYQNDKIVSSYEGFFTRDFSSLNEHFTKSGRTDFNSLSSLIKEFNESNIGVMIHVYPDTTNPPSEGDFGGVFKDGNKISDIRDNKMNWLKREPFVPKSVLSSKEIDNYIEYIYQNEFINQAPGSAIDFASFSEQFRANPSLYTSKYRNADLAKLNLSNTYVKEYLRKSFFKLIDLKVDGFLINSIDSLPMNYFEELSSDLKNKNKDINVIGNSAETKRPFTFNHRFKNEMKDLFKNKKNLANLSSYIDLESSQNTSTIQLSDSITYLDFPYQPRLVTEGFTAADFMEMLKIQFATKGIPFILYGSENFIQDTNGFQPMMTFTENFETNPNIKLIKQLTDLRKKHPALKSGNSKVLYSSSSHIYFERKFGDDSIVVLVHDSLSLAHSKRFEFPGEYNEIPLIETAGRPSKWKVRFFEKATLSN